MNPFDNYSWFLMKRQEELFKRIDEIRLVDLAYEDKPKKAGKSKFLALIGKELESVGYSLELRFGSQADARVSFNQQSTQGGCAERDKE